MSYRTNEPEPEKEKEPVNYLELAMKSFAVVLGAALAAAVIAVPVMYARSDGKVDHCYMDTSTYYDLGKETSHYFVRVKGHRSWRGDVDLWDEKVDLNNTNHSMERVGMAVSQFCPNGKVH